MCWIGGWNEQGRSWGGAGAEAGGGKKQGRSRAGAGKEQESSKAGVILIPNFIQILLNHSS